MIGFTNIESSSGHVIEDAAGSALNERANLQFAGYLKTTDDSTNNRSVVSDAPTEITYENYMAMTPAQKQGTKWLITNAPGHLATNQAIFTLAAQELTFTGTTATVSDQRINTSTYPIIYWDDSSIEAAGDAHITTTVSNGQITFTAETAPASTLTCDIVFISNAYSGGAGHEIENSAGTKLTQRDVMQVTDGLEAVDDSTGQKTKIGMNLPIVSSADWNAMTEQEQEAYKASHYRFGVEIPDTSGVINAEYMKLLWENPNTTQAFASQTITLNSTDYDFLLWIFSANIGFANKQYKSVICGKGESCILDVGNLNYLRSCIYNSATSYSIVDGTDTSTNNYLCVPVAIYGIKKDFQFKVNAIADKLSTRADHCFLDDEVTTVEDIVTANELQPYINVASYKESNPYVCPSDGYFSVSCASGSSITGRISSATNATSFIIGTSTANEPSVIFVKKGMRINVRTSSGTTYAEFYPLEA